ncbi:MAG: SIR2 family protein [Chloroflexota bacterium]
MDHLKTVKQSLSDQVHNLSQVEHNQAIIGDAYRRAEELAQAGEVAMARHLLYALVDGDPNFTPAHTLLSQLRRTYEADEEKSYDRIGRALRDGRLIIFLGDDIPRMSALPSSGPEPPSASETMATLIEDLPDDLRQTHFTNGHGDVIGSLPQITQYFSLLEGEIDLYDQLHTLYSNEDDVDLTLPNTLHWLLATIPQRLRTKGYPKSKNRRYVIFTTAFDELLEDAFDAMGQPYHLFAYRPHRIDEDGVNQSEHFVHYPAALPYTTRQMKPIKIEIDKANAYHGHDQDNHPVIVKLCGQRISADEPNSVLLTEDQFLAYNQTRELKNLLPTSLLDLIQRNSMLFFGHSLQPWHLRLIWQYLRPPAIRRNIPNWAIHPGLNEVEAKFWAEHNITPIDTEPETVVDYLYDWLEALS